MPSPLLSYPFTVAAVAGSFIIMKPRYSEGDEPIGVCCECGEFCTGRLVDNGIGPYEYGSLVGCDEKWEWVSPCCHAEILPEEEL